MIAQRPSFTRVDTDMALTELHPESQAPSSKCSPDSTSVDVEADQKPHDVKRADPEVAEVLAENEHFGESIVIQNATDLVTYVLHVSDDNSLSPWTFRAFFLGENFVSSL